MSRREIFKQKNITKNIKKFLNKELIKIHINIDNLIHISEFSLVF